MNLENYIISKWTDFDLFCNDFLSINQETNLLGFGFIYNKDSSVNDSDSIKIAYHLVVCSDYIIGFCGESIDGLDPNESTPLFFHEIVLFDKKILSDGIFNRNSFSNRSKISNLDCELNVEIKPYIYEDEKRIFISKAGRGNIDLFASYILDGQEYHITPTIQQSVYSSSKQALVNKMLEDRIKNIKK